MFGAPVTNWVETVLAKLDRYDGLTVDFSDTHISVTSQNPNSFDVSINADGDAYHVSFGGWHEHIDDQEEALNCFALGLSEDCRLKVVKRGLMECSWTVQTRENEDWVDYSTTGLIFIPLWRRAHVEYR